MQCPYCLRENDTHAPTDNLEDQPSPGDVSICWKCHQIGIFTEDGTIRRASPEEDAKIRTEDNVRDALMVIQKSYLPTEAAALLRASSEWTAERFRTETGEENA